MDEPTRVAQGPGFIAHEMPWWCDEYEDRLAMHDDLGADEFLPPREWDGQVLDLDPPDPADWWKRA